MTSILLCLIDFNLNFSIVFLFAQWIGKYRCPLPLCRASILLLLFWFVYWNITFRSQLLINNVEKWAITSFYTCWNLEFSQLVILTRLFISSYIYHAISIIPTIPSQWFNQSLILCSNHFMQYKFMISNQTIWIISWIWVLVGHVIDFYLKPMSFFKIIVNCYSLNESWVLFWRYYLCFSNFSPHVPIWIN